MQATNRTAEQIVVTLLGGFSIRVGEKEVHETSARTHQLWHLIEYLITFRHQEISQQELIRALWPEGNIENPANALKNLVYRVRSSLNQHGLPYAKNMIVYSRGGYRWNNSLPCAVDAEQFEQLCQRAAEPGLSAEQTARRCMEAADLYKGDFLPNARFESWVIPVAGRYRSMYFQCVYTALEILAEQERFAEMEALCRKAIAIDPFEEPAQCHLLHAMIRQDKQRQAMTHYSQVTDLFFRELGIGPSTAMRALYREIAKTVHDVEIDLSIIQEDLRESGAIQGAFYCEYEVFKNLYRLEARTAARSGQSIFLCLVTLEDAAGNLLEVHLQNKMMDSLHGIIHGSLRQGDVFARFSGSQYVLMLPALTYENCAMVMDRIMKRFRGTTRGKKDVCISTKAQPLDPIDLADPVP